MNVDEIRDMIPYYLTRDKAEGFMNELKSFSSQTRIITDHQDELFLQGDGWHGFSLFSFATGQKRKVRGIIVSNSCDISSDNQRDIPAKVTFVPLMKLSAIEKILESDETLSADARKNKIESIKRQESTSFFFIPSQGILEEDSVAWFNDAHSMPTDFFLADHNQERQRIFSLTMVGFYLFLFKLSIHYCRFHEKVDRPLQ